MNWCYMNNTELKCTALVCAPQFGRFLLPPLEYQGTCLVLLSASEKYNYSPGTCELTCDKRLTLMTTTVSYRQVTRS